MASRLPTTTLRRAQISQAPCSCTSSQVRHATLLSRPHRPYTFTQLITLSDGSTYISRTTSPVPIHKSTKDTRNHPMWQPSLSSLKNVEQDEAGRLRAFRNRFGRGWDLDATDEELSDAQATEEAESLMDLISGNAPKSVLTSASTSASKSGDDDVEMITIKQDGKLVKVAKKPVKEKEKKKGGWGSD